MRVPFALLFLGLVASASAQRLGQTKEQVVAESGPATEENHSKGTAVYRHQQLKIDVTYENGVARKLVCTSFDPMSDETIRGILQLNAAGGSWHELNMSGALRFWQSSNFAQAKCDRVNPRVLTLHGGVSFPSSRPITPVASATAARDTASMTSVSSLRTPRSPGQNVVNNAVSVVAGGVIAALFGVAFPVVLIGLLAVFVVKRFVPWLLRRNVDVRATIIQRPIDSPLKKAPRMRPAQLRARPLPEIVAAAPQDAPTLDSLRWENFELLIGEIYRRKGYAVEISSGLGADGGKDLTLRKNNELVVVQCKKLAIDNRVSESQMRDFFGLITAEGATKGFFTTTGYFSSNVKRFAAGKPIELIERAEVERLVAEVSAWGENLYDVTSWIDSFLSRAHVVDPLCPFCENRMKLRRGALGKLFWGCSSFPRCRGKRNGREDLLRTRQCQGG